MKKAKNIVDKAREFIEAETTARGTEVADIESKLTLSREALGNANLAMKAATERTDLEAYATAKADKEAAEIAVEMYTSRLEQIIHKDFISEAESDNIIAELKAHAAQLDDDFRSKAAPILAQLDALAAAYLRDVMDTVSTARTWTQKIRPYYISNGTQYFDKETGQMTNRSPRPVDPFPITPICADAREMDEYLKKAAHIYKAVPAAEAAPAAAGTP